MYHYPPFERVISGRSTDRLLEVNRSLLSILSSFALFFFSALAVYLLNYFFYDFRIPVDVPLINQVSTRWLAVVPAIILLEIVRKYHDDLYLFGRERITHLEGRLSLTSSVPSLKYTDIKAIMIHQDILGRIFDYGDIALGSSAQDGNELTIAGVRGPVALASLIERFRQYNLVQSAAPGNPSSEASDAAPEQNPETAAA